MSNFTVIIKKNPASIVEAIRLFELEFGENYLERNDFFVDATVIMQFAYEKGYITKDKFNLWKDGFDDNELGTEETFEVIFSEYEEHDIYCITYMDENIEKDYNEQYSDALLVYGELICSKNKYYEEFVDVFKSAVENLNVDIISE